MPAKSKDQQRAAAIALKAKKDGKVDDLPSGAAKNMAKSMSEKELGKFASTKHKGLPENKPNEYRTWAGESLLEVFAEEMVDSDEDPFTSDKNTRDQIEDAEREHEDDTGWDAYDDSWDSKVNAAAPMGQAGRPMGSNVTGAARVSFESVTKGRKVRKESHDPNSLDILFEGPSNSEYSLGDEWEWDTGSDVGFADLVSGGDSLAIEMGDRLNNSMVSDMVDHIITHYNLHGKMPDEWLPEELLADFEYDYSVSQDNPEDIDSANSAVEQAKEEINAPEELRFESKRWQKLAGVKLLKESDHSEEDSDEEDSEDSDEEHQKQEAMLGGVSNGGPAPGHRAKMNEDSDLVLLAQGKAHRVDVFNVRDELAGLAFEIAGEIQGMHLDTSDRKTEKMLQSKLGNMYKHLLKLKSLVN